MTRGKLMETMKYLGYVTHLEDGTPNPTAEKVCDDLAGRVIESAMLAYQIGHAWDRHTPHKKQIGDSGAYLARVDDKLRSAIKQRLELLRVELRAERISYDELHELQSLAAHIEPDDVELLEAAGVPEKLSDNA